MFQNLTSVNDQITIEGKYIYKKIYEHLYVCVFSTMGLRDKRYMDEKIILERDYNYATPLEYGM